MEATQQQPQTEEPVSERTRAIIQLTSQLEDVTQDVRAIRQMLREGQTWRAAAWRAITQFIGDLKR